MKVVKRCNSLESRGCEARPNSIEHVDLASMVTVYMIMGGFQIIAKVHNIKE